MESNPIRVREHTGFDDHIGPRFQGREGNTEAADCRHRHSTLAINRSHDIARTILGLNANSSFTWTEAAALPTNTMLQTYMTPQNRCLPTRT